MTSFAFILGVVPLIVAHGAGAEMRKVLGVAVFSGMLGVTLFGIFLTPVFFYVIEGFAESHPWTWLRRRLRRRARGQVSAPATLSTSATPQAAVSSNGTAHSHAKVTTH